MRHYLTTGLIDVEILWETDRDPGETYLEFPDSASATFLLEDLYQTHPAELRGFLLDLRPEIQSHNLDEYQIVDLLAPFVVRGELLFLDRTPRYSGVGMEEEGSEEEGGSTETTTVKHWIEFQVLDRETGDPIADVPLQITLADQAEKAETTDSDGRIKIDDVPNGSCSITCKIEGKGIELKDSWNFVTVERFPPQNTIEREEDPERGDGPPRIAKISKQRVSDGETLESVAEQNGMTAEELSKFNWGIEDTEEGNNRMKSKGSVFVPRTWSQSGLRTDMTHMIHVEIVQAKLVHILEMEDLQFHHDSAVMMADYEIDEKAAVEGRRVTGLAVLKACYDHISDFPKQKLLIAGHTDSSGSDSYNESLSEKRAKNVYQALTGDRDAWVSGAKDHHQVEDYQQILRWVSNTRGWDCDPGEVDNKSGSKTKAAVKEFQKAYNGAFDESIDEDGIVGTQSWGAFFDIYMKVLVEILQTDPGIEITSIDDHFVPGEENIEIQYQTTGVSDKTVKLLVESCQYPHNPLYEKTLEGADIADGTHSIQWDGKSTCTDGDLKDKLINPLYAPYQVRFSCEGNFPEGEDGLSTARDSLTFLHGGEEVIGCGEKYPIEGVGKNNYRSSTDRRVEFIFFDEGEEPSGDAAAACEEIYSEKYARKYVPKPDLPVKREFKVLIDSLVIKKGPWTPDEKAPEESAEKDWVQYKLNELGYYGGPVGKDKDDYLKKAVIRYKANHVKMQQLNYGNYNDTITADLKSALKNGDNSRTWIDESTFSDKNSSSRILIEAVTYEVGEFGNDKNSKEKGRINRPLVPVEVDVYLKKKDNQKVLAPEAVGPIRISWKFKDRHEDISSQYTETTAEPSQTQNYLEECLQVKDGRTDETGDNCPESLGGLREGKDDDWKTPWYIDDSYTPYEAKKDDDKKLVYTECCIDKENHEKRVGKAGIFFRPSSIAGDSYQLSAEVDFSEQRNKKQLSKFHGITGEENPLRLETGTFQNWRFGRISVLVNWPARSNDSEWSKIRNEFQKAYLDLDVSNIAVKSITDVLTTAEYQAIVMNNTSHSDPAQITLEPDSIVGVPLPQQGALDNNDYESLLGNFVNENFWNKIYEATREKLSEKLRKDFPSGFIQVDFLTHKPVNIEWDPANGDHDIAEENHVAWTFSIGLPDSVIFVDQKDPDKLYYVVAHEMAHNFWLYHWEHAGGDAIDHDINDHNCIMSYSSNNCIHGPHHGLGVGIAHFCGKCNLKIRGWKTNTSQVPSGS